MKEKIADYIVTAAGVILFLVGLFLTKAVEEPQGVMLALPYICIGIGCGMFGRGISMIVNRNIMEKHPEIEKQKRIEETDERNVIIANKAKARAYGMAMIVFDVLLLAYALMGVDIVPILMLVGGYLFVIGYGIYCRCKYEKEM